MSLYDSVQLFCEGEDGSEDVILLEQARFALEKSGYSFAEQVVVVPVGNKDGLKAYLKTLLAHQGKHGAAGRVYAVRDRDFLTRSDLADRRAKAVSGADAWPLARHSIESYLADPDYLAQVFGVAASSIAEDLDTLAQQQLWDCVVTACCEDLAYRSRALRPNRPPAASRDLAIEALQEVIKQFPSQLAEELAVPVEERVDHFAGDFLEDGPIWTRVRGKDLLGALKSRLQDKKLPVKRLRTENLAPWGAPAALVRDLEAFFSAISESLFQSSG